MTYKSISGPAVFAPPVFLSPLKGNLPMPRRTPRNDYAGAEPAAVMERRLARGRAYLTEKGKDLEWRAKKAAYMREYNRKYREDPVKKAARDAQIRAWGRANPESKARTFAKYRLTRRGAALVAQIKKRAKLKGWEFDLDPYIPDIQRRIDAGVCEITGYPFDLTPPDKGTRRFNTPSLDRINPKRGYTYDNVRVVLCLVNVALNDWGENVLREVMQRWLSK